MRVGMFNTQPISYQLNAQYNKDNKIGVFKTIK